MKKNILISAFLGAALLVACQPAEPEKTEEFGSLSINLNSPELLTKGDVTAQTHESKVNKMRVMIYDNTDQIVKDTLLASPYNSLNINQIKIGQYSVCAIANSCASISSTPGIVHSMEELSNKSITLDDCSLTESTGFVMFDKTASVNVTAGTSSQAVNMSVTRFPARIRLVSVTNALPAFLGDISVEYVMIINGYSRWNICGTGKPTVAVNSAGRNSAGQIISTAEGANYPNHSFWAVPQADKTISSTPAKKNYGHCFYSFPNSITTDVTTSGTGGGKLRLVVAARVDSKIYYYPVTLTNVERNKSYDVVLTITGLGSEDPNIPVQKGAAGFNITVTNWGAGTDYSETI